MLSASPNLSIIFYTLVTGREAGLFWDVVGPSLLLYMDADIRPIMHVSAHGQSVSEWRSDVIFTVTVLEKKA